ncbi:hypothetical protein CWE04_11560 [Thomasclavelia cocleata]|uniref:Uncharacterized protein n=1 Tax=Thomasclavelia cocleata TaxID=69824 RepID=A0A1I0GE62_9FIRM|nr:hypothetical protein [Thomasclavelia cocleata]MCR1959839.1 hypothetical protein [Thomasclavelia cocleata]NDO43189.1 hypothetical protein [Thomasclavelia cocleata]PJN79839.1 hypothetical protein CWE04_11560 [Thomasclavelia cocleata]SET68447.1 hypothetical protein SAMN04489758_12814 [Thomasclavelia cocleata]
MEVKYTIFKSRATTLFILENDYWEYIQKNLSTCKKIKIEVNICEALKELNIDATYKSYEYFKETDGEYKEQYLYSLEIKYEDSTFCYLYSFDEKMDVCDINRLFNSKFDNKYVFDLS